MQSILVGSSILQKLFDAKDLQHENFPICASVALIWAACKFLPIGHLDSTGPACLCTLAQIWFFFISFNSGFWVYRGGDWA